MDADLISTHELLAAGQKGPREAPTSFLSAIALDNGEPIWTEELPAPAVQCGTAVDAEGRILVSLTNDEVVCFCGP